MKEKKGFNTMEKIQAFRLDEEYYINWTFNEVLFHLNRLNGAVIYNLGINEYLCHDRSEWCHFWTGIRNNKLTVIDSEAYKFTKRTYREMCKILNGTLQ